MAKKLGIGVIGLGFAGNESLKGMAQDDRVRLAAVCDINRPLAERVARQYSVPSIYARIKDILADPQVDTITVALPNHLHAPTAVAALRAGKHVICEKPPTISAAEAAQVARTAKSAGRVMMYALCLRYGPEAQYLRKLTDAGELGDIYFAKCAYIRRSGIPIGASAWFVDKSRAGGGALVDIGVHALDLTWYLMGNPKPVAVSGASFRKFGHKVPAAVKYDVDDSSFGFIKFDTGAVLFLEATWALNLPADSYCHVAGTKAGAKLNPLTIFKEVNGAPVELTPHPGGQDMFAAESRHFIDCILQKKTPISSAEQGVTLMKMLNGIYASASSGREVRIR